MVNIDREERKDFHLCQKVTFPEAASFGTEYGKVVMVRARLLTITLWFPERTYILQLQQPKEFLNSHSFFNNGFNERMLI